MNAQTVGWLVILAILQTDFFCGSTPNPFQVQDTHLTATEGSCAEIKCKVKREVTHPGEYWFWLKNATWTDLKSDFTGTVIFSTNHTERPVSPDFANKVRYLGGLTFLMPSKCSILICNLSRTDSGNYSFRYVGVASYKWRTDDVNLTVAENPCPLTFEKPPVVKESGTTTLTCSTLSSCPSYPLIQDLNGPDMKEHKPANESTKITTASITVSWENDGKEFSCQTQDNKDSYLIKNVSVTVEYAPKDVQVHMASGPIREGESVNLTCTAKGRPQPNFVWFRKLNDEKEIVSRGAEWKIQAINDSESGEYVCQAQNDNEVVESKPVTINVTYIPQVEVKMTSSHSSSTQAVVKERDEMTLKCIVKRSNPQPRSYVWSKGGKEIGSGETHNVPSVKPEDSGTYECVATNDVGTGTSQFQIEVEYSPRKTSITKHDKVKVNSTLTFHCITDANPRPEKYSWYRYNEDKDTDSTLPWKSYINKTDKLTLEHVQRADEACYICNATNRINTGENSHPMCIKVLYPPSKVILSMDRSSEVIEDQPITISCTVESFPLSHLTLRRISTSHSLFPEEVFSQPNNNTLQRTFNVTSTHAGNYSCYARNSEGSKQSITKTLVVKYRPKNVKVKAHPDLVVDENTTLTLSCFAQSFPSVTSVTWIKTTEGKREIIKNWNITLSSVSPSDSGLYSCEASNEIGTGKSQQDEVKVRYAPKHTEIIMAAEQQQPDGRSSVLLSCTTRSYPHVTKYTWHKKTSKDDSEVSENQNHTVYSNEPGLYYCIATNEINQKASEPVELFVNRGLIMALKFCLPFLIILLIVLIVLVYRLKRNKSHHQGTRITPSFAFLGWWNGTRKRDQMNELVMAEPFRSRDDLLADQSNGRRCQPRPDSTPAANISSVYCTVNLPTGQGPSAQQPIRQQGGHTEDYSLNYASLDFGNEPKNKHAKAEQAVVYAMVSKPPKKREQGRLDYENVGAIHAAKPPDPLSYEMDTSSAEEELSYTKVNFTGKPGHQRSSSDSTSSDEEELSYAKVNFTGKPGHQRSSSDSTSSDEEELSYTKVNFVAKPGHQRSSSDSTSSDEDGTQYSDVKL